MLQKSKQTIFFWSNVKTKEQKSNEGHYSKNYEYVGGGRE
jgi:hypothetical protein